MYRKLTLLVTFSLICFGSLVAQFKTESVLAQGSIHKISVEQTGVYRLDYNFIKDKLKVEPSTITSGRIAIFSNGSGRIPQANADPRIDDLEQVATLGVGLDDGQFQSGDYILWYGEGPDQWTYDPLDRSFQMDNNIYDNQNHYYVIINGPGRLAMTDRAAGSGGQYVSSTSQVFQRLEEDKVNLLGRYRPPGTGQEFYGDEMAVVTQLDYTDRFDLTDMVPGDTLHYKMHVALRAGASNRVYLHLGSTVFDRIIGAVNLDDFDASFANDAVIQGKFMAGFVPDKIQVRYPNANGVNSRAWIDYLQLNFWKQNKYQAGKLLSICDPRQSYLGAPTYEIENLPQGGMIWDVTDPLNVLQQQYERTDKVRFNHPGESLNTVRQYVAFNPAQDVLTPLYTGVVENQNLHAIETAQMLIVYYDDFEEAALELAEHRSMYSALNVVAVPVSKVFEEFGGGSADPAAIRDFARMLYQRDPEFRYLLLIGDATYDYLNINPELPYHNFIPAFETEKSLDPIRSFPSDDFFALLDESEGRNLVGAIDIAVGRLTATTAEEAMGIVNKIIYYDTNPSTLANWRNRIVMVADDQDGNTHLNQADNLATQMQSLHPLLNQEKVYLDAYPQESTPGGDRYPAVVEAIDENIRKGALSVTYLGHGGPNGWTQERVLGINQAQSYSNLDNMPLFITATCSFAGYDEPGYTTTGEHLLRNPNGGSFALMTTVRAVFSGSNERLTESVLKRLYKPDAPGVYPTIGEVLRRAKNANALDTIDHNARKFTLLGDPAQHLAIPRYTVAVATIGGKPVGSVLDTLSALEKTTLTGFVLGFDGEVLTSFNGQLTLTLFDKRQVRKTLANDNDSNVREFFTQNRQLFRGTASVVNGEWSIEFVLPKDIDFSYGQGKMSLYAQDGITDASGFTSEFIIGGVSEEGLQDDEPPVVRLFMNDTLFRSGGITDANPDIYILLRDDNGINVAGTSIGHDIEAILDGDSPNAFILNDYYQAALNDYRSGEVRYPLSNLSPGRHTLKVSAWDLANNVAEAEIEFFVVDEEGPVIRNLSHAPNPFYDDTRIQFEHNRAGSVADVTLQVFNAQGIPVRTWEQKDWLLTGYRSEEILWKGDSDTKAPLLPGMYFYKVTADFKTGNSVERAESEVGKLIRM